MTTQESEVDVLAVMDEWIAKAALDPKRVRMDREIREARAAVAEVFEAIKVYREHFRQSGCPDPACIVCHRSKAAADRLDTALRNAGVKV